MFRRIASISVIASLALGMMIAGATTASASSGDEQGFVSRINAERRERGLRALVVKSDLTTVARRHSRDMAAEGGIWHNPRLPEQVNGWERLGENVGVGGSVQELHDAFMDSQSHRQNILKSAYNEIGVGIAVKNGTIFVTEVFAQRFGSARAVTKKVVRKIPVRRKPLRSTTTTTATKAPTRPAPQPAAATAAAPAPAPQAVDVLLRIVRIDQ